MGTKHLPGLLGNKHDGFEIGPCLDALFDFVWEQIDVIKPDLIGFEAPLPPQAMRFQQKSTGLARLQFSMTGIIEMITHRRNIPCEEARIDEVKKFWTTNGRASKGSMIQMCRMLGWKPVDDNAADAAALWALLKSDNDKGFRFQTLPMFAPAHQQILGGARS